MSKSVPYFAKSYVHLAVCPLFVIVSWHRTRHMGLFDRDCTSRVHPLYHITLWHQTRHGPFCNISRVRSFIVKSRRGTGPGTDQLRVVLSNIVLSAAPHHHAPALVTSHTSTLNIFAMYPTFRHTCALCRLYFVSPPPLLLLPPPPRLSWHCTARCRG